MYTDSHAHLYKEYYDDIDDVIIKSKDNKIKRIINVATDVSTSKEVVESLVKESVYGAVGIHPEFTDSYTDEDINSLEDMLKNDKVIAIGEIGLDYHYEGFDKEKQIILFKKMLDLASKYNLPVIIHMRDATEDAINILSEYKNLKGVIHAFSGSKETALRFIKMGYYLGVGGVVTFKNCNLINVYKEIGIENIILETDCPYLTPVPFRGKQNYPGNVYYVAKFLSDNLNISMEDISKITENNVNMLFNIQ